MGRPRKKGERYPSGDLRPTIVIPFRAKEREIEPREVVINHKTVTLIAVPTALSRLKLTREQQIAAERYQDLVRRYRAFLESPNPLPSIARPEGGGGSRVDWDGLSLAAQNRLVDEASNVIREYTDIHKTVLKGLERQGVELVCLEDHPAPAYWVKRGLNDLVKHWNKK